MHAYRLALGHTLCTLVLAAQGASAADFSPEAIALPYPPDTRELEFVAWAGDIKFNSSSPLKSIAAFYLKEMATRGWEHDDADAKVEDGSIRLVFKHERSKVQIDLSQWSKEVKARLDCDNLQFNGTDDPAKLAAAGIPVPPAAVFVQRELPLPTGAQNVSFTGEGATLKSSLTLPELFDHYMRLAAAKGFRESRKPILSDSRRYTEFKKGAAQLNVNAFTDPVGSRVVLTYKDAVSQATVPPLAAVVSLPIGKAGTDQPSAGQPGQPGASALSDATPIDVSANKGSANVLYGGRQFNFPHVAAYRTKSRARYATMIVFSAGPIPYHKLQSLVASKDDVSLSDLYEFSSPHHLTLQLGDHQSFSFSGPGVGIGQSIEGATNEIKIEPGRVEGTLKMPPMKVFSDESISFNVSVNAAIILPSTRITGPGDPVQRSDSPILTDAPITFPDGVESSSREGSKFRKTYHVVVRKPLADVMAFYRQELPAKGWNETPGSDAEPRFQHAGQEMSLRLKPDGAKTTIELVTRDSALAKREGVLPEAGKGRLVLGNGADTAVTFTIGNNQYPLRAGQGREDYKQALNYSVAPTTYTITLRVAGQSPKTEKVEITAGTTWGVIAMPNGEMLPVQLY